jgi:hypothetical protein
MSDWKLPCDGGCRCGRTRFRVTAPPLLASACHCSGCRSMTASAFSLSLSVPADGFAIIAGTPVPGGLHKDQHYFCGECMSWMFTRIPGIDHIVNLRATLLDEHRWFEPYVEFFTAEKLPWATTPAKRSYEQAPEPAAFQDLIAAYQAEGTRPS